MPGTSAALEGEGAAVGSTNQERARARAKECTEITERTQQWSVGRHRCKGRHPEEGGRELRFHPISGAEGSTWERHSGEVRTRDLSLKRDLLVLGRRTWPAQPINASPAAGRRLPLPRNLFRAPGQGEGQTSRNALRSPGFCQIIDLQIPRRRHHPAL